MAGKKISQLDVKTPAPTDLVAVGDQFTGIAGKSTCKQVVFAGMSQQIVFQTGSSFAYEPELINMVGSVNNLSLGSSAIHRASSSVVADITGIAPPTVGPLSPGTGTHLYGRTIHIYNQGTNTITLKHESSLSSAGNRLYSNLGSDIALTAGSLVMMIYDIGINRWRMWKIG